MLTKTYFRRKLAQACGLGLVLCAAAACAPQQNVLTKEEIADGWQLLFDGKTLDQWKDYNGEELTMPWHVVDGCIQAKGDGSDLAGYIVTKKQYENFILDWDWKLSHGGNSGMIYHVVEDPYFKVPYVTGPEYQLIDNEGWEEVNAPNKLEEWQKLGVDYAMHLPDPDSLFVNPQGEWNSSRIVFDNGHVEHWLNGHKILEFEAWTDDWFARKHSGKWETAPEYGLARRGVICLQDHGSPASFRNLKIKELPRKAGREVELFNGKDLTGWEAYGTEKWYVDKDGNMPRMREALLADAVGTVTGACTGTSTVTTFVESASGVEAGGRTGLTALTTGLLFLASMFLAPIAAIIPAAATSSALIYVGLLMLGGLKKIDFDDIYQSLPVAIMLISMPVSGSIGHVIGLGLISYSVLKLCTGKGKDVSLLTYAISLLFLVKFFLVA